MLLKYRTINKNSEAEIIEKKSRFIGYTAYISTEEEAQGIINSIKKKNYNASHNTFAYRIEGNIITERQSDDGEPSGTAGLPMLDILRGEGLLNVLVVVTRYFGGTLLGTGGLVRAYSKAAKAVLLKSQIIEKKLYSAVNIKVDYTLSGKVQYEILNTGHVLWDTLYTENVEFIVFVEAGIEDAFIKKINEVIHAKGEITIGEKVYGTVIDGEFIKL